MTINHTPELDALLHQAMEADFQAEKAQKLKNFQYLNQYIKKGQILFTGSSLMEHFPVAECLAHNVHPLQASLMLKEMSALQDAAVHFLL